MDKIDQLYELFLESGIISDAVSPEQFRNTNDSQREQLFDLGVQEGLFETTTLSDFNRPWFEAAGGAERMMDIVEPVKKKDPGALELPSDPISSALPDPSTEEFQEMARQRQQMSLPDTEYQQIVALEEEAKSLPTISRRQGEIQNEIQAIRTRNQIDPLTASDETTYSLINQKIGEIDSEIQAITDRYETVARQQSENELDAYNLKNELLASDQNLAYLKQQKELYERDNERNEEAIRQLSMDTGASGYLGKGGYKNILESLLGLFYVGTAKDKLGKALFSDEVVEYTDEFKERLIRSIDGEYEMERLLGGKMPLKQKEEIIFRAKMDFIQDKERELQQAMSDPNATKEEKQKALDKMSMAFFDAGYDVINGRFRNMFKTSEDLRRYKESAAMGKPGFVKKLLDVLGTFGQAAGETAGGYAVGAPAEIGVGGYNILYDMLGGDDKYTSADKFMDGLDRIITTQILPSSEEKGMLFDDEGNFKFSVYGASKGVAETLPFTLSILLAMRRGDFKLPDKSNLATRLMSSAKDPANAYQTYKLITTSYRTALTQSMRTARELGLEGSDAAIYGNANALMEGITNTIMPDYKYFQTAAGQAALFGFAKNLKDATTRSAKAAAARSFVGNIIKEIGEEEAMALYEDLSKTATFADHELFSEFADINRQKQLLTVTIGLSGGLGAVRIPAQIKQSKADIYKDIHNNAETLLQMLDDEIAANPARAEELQGVKTYINDVDRAVATSPENVTFEQVDLLTQKIKLQREMESVDEAYRAPYKEKIDAINQEIVEAAKSYKVEVSEQEAKEALEEEGVTEPTTQEVIKKQDELIKEKEDAVQEQKAGDIPDVKPAEAVQEVEEEVREPVVQEEEVVSPIQENLQEGEAIVQTKEDEKGRVFTYTKQESKKDGVKKTKFFFNRSDKAADQRNSAGVDEDAALADTEYEIDPADKAGFEEDLEDGSTVKYKVNEIREGKSGAAATVTVETTLPDGTVLRQKAEVALIKRRPSGKPKKAAPSAEIEQQVQDLFSVLQEENPQFQLATSMSSEQKKQELVKEATKQMEESEQVVSEEVADVQEMLPGAKTITIEVKENTELANKVRRMGLSELVGKKINLVMADQLKVSDKYMGGPFFPLMEKLFGKVAWASITKTAAKAIVKGAINADYSVVFNMNPTAVISNKAFRENILDSLSQADQVKVFDLLKEYMETSRKKKLKQAVAESKTLVEFFEKMDDFGTKEKIDLFNAILPTEKISPNTGIGKFLKEKGLTIERLSTDVSEQFVKDLPAGAMTMVLQVTDKNGNPVTKKTANEAIITQEQQEAEGLPKHPNYPVYIRGKAVGLLNETVPFWEMTKNVFDTINKKVAGVVRKKVGAKEEKVSEKTGEVTPATPETTRKFSAKEAYNDAYYQAQLNADKAIRMVDPMVDDYTRFVSMLSTAIPSVEVVTTQERFEELSDDIYSKKLSTKSQKVYGAIYKGKLYLNPALQNYNTPVHEFGHMWTNVVKETDRALYDKGISLIEKSDYVQQVEDSKEYQKVIKQMKQDGATEQQIREYVLEEALATAIGDKGESFVIAAQKKNFKTWLNDLFNFIKKLTGISKYTSEQLQNINLDKFLEGVVVDLMSGTVLFQDAQVNNIGDALQLMTGKAPNQIDMYGAIQYARQNGFNDEAIKIYLRRQGYKVAEINEAMAVPFEIGTNVPLEFGNVKGGMLKGVQMYKNVLDKLKKWKKRNKSASFEDARKKGVEFLSQEQGYKAADDTLQKELVLAFNKNLGMTKDKQVNEDMKKFREILRDRKRVEKQLNRIKTDLRIFIRKNMPKASWENKEVQQLMTAIANATPKNIQVIYNDVANVITRKNVKNQLDAIDKFRQTKTTTVQAGRVKGKMLVESQERIDKIKEDISLDNKSSVDSVERKIQSLQQEYGKLMMKDVLSESEMNRVEDIQMALQYNEALLMDDTAPIKTETLSEVSQALKDVVAGERTIYKEAMTEATKRYNKLKNDFFQDIAGFKVDFNDPKSTQEAKERVKRKLNIKDNRSNARKVIGNVLTNLDKFTFMRVEGLEGLLDRISKSYGKMFGGKSSEMILDKIDESTIAYKSGSMQQISFLEENAKRIFGKNYRKIAKANTVKNVKISSINPSAVEKLMADLKKASTKEEQRAISKEIDELTELMSQNEMYYLYNQYKDPANHPGFETKFGENYREVMAEVTEKLDPKVKEWADWQVDEYFPSVYERYNTTYKQIYRTNMPWNAKYAGRIVREGSEESDPTSMLDMGSTEFRTAVGSASSKVRIKNSKSIMTVDGDAMLARYIDDMEYFRGYAENMRDIVKFYRNPLIKDAVIATSGKEVYDVINDKFNKILNRKLAASMSDISILNMATRGFVLSKLGLNPTIFLKQMTSALAFADYIGYRNWLEYGIKELENGVGAWNSTWRELYKNSVYLQDRYEAKDFSKVIESYNKTSLNEISGGVETDRVVDFLMYMVKQGDKGGIMGAIPNYSYYKDQYKKNNPKATDQEVIDYAVKKAERQIKTTQQSSDIQDRDFYQTDNAFYRAMSLFTSSPRALVRKEVISVRNLYRKMANLPSKGTTKENLRTFFTYHVAIPMFFQYVALGLPGLLRPWRDDDDEELGMAAVLGNLNSLFIVGDLLASARDTVLDKPWASSFRNLPIFELAEDFYKSIQKTQTIKDPQKKAEAWKKTMFSLLEYSGIPASQMNKWYKNFKEIGTGGADNIGELMLRLLNYSDYVIVGEKKKAQKYIKMPKQK